jgi:hypothetical protein
MLSFADTSKPAKWTILSLLPRGSRSPDLNPLLSEKGDAHSSSMRAAAAAIHHLWARLGDLRQVVRQRARCADSGHQPDGVPRHTRPVADSRHIGGLSRRPRDPRFVDSLLEGAVSSELVSDPKFPASWEHAGNFVDSGLNDASKGAKKGSKSVAPGPIPYAAQQGIFCTLAGN